MAPTTPPMPSRRQRAGVRPCLGHRVRARRRRTPPPHTDGESPRVPHACRAAKGMRGAAAHGAGRGSVLKGSSHIWMMCGRASLGRQLLQIDTPLRRMWEVGPRARYASAGMPRDPCTGNRLTGQRTRVCPTACGVAEVPPALAAWTIHASLRPSAGRGFGPGDDTTSAALRRRGPTCPMRPSANAGTHSVGHRRLDWT